MVAYSFKKQFFEPIQVGTKVQTVRAVRKRHARPGEELQLYVGMRTKQCRLIGRAICQYIEPIRFDFETNMVSVPEYTIVTPGGLDSFARRDGFEDWKGLCAFWEKEHAAIRQWEGVVIRWRDFMLPGVPHV